MTLGLYETRLRRGRRFRWAIVRWVLAVAAVAGAAAFSYEIGSSRERHQLTDLHAQIDDLSVQVEALRQQNTDLQAGVIVVEEHLRDAKLEIPSGPVADLLDRVREKLDAGVDIERLRFLVNAAVNTPRCSELPVSKRFMAQTLLFAGANDSVAFADGTITVTARGESAINAEGNAEAWFDAAKPIELILTRIGGRVTEVTGKLPLHTSVVVGDVEHRFSAAAGSQGFVQITSARCDLS